MCIYYTGGLGRGSTGAGMNPWKALGPMLVTGNYDRAWIYILIPFIAALVNGFIYAVAPPKFFEKKKDLTQPQTIGSSNEEK
jgi:glycerol uptake facilitator-like aquaporin